MNSLGDTYRLPHSGPVVGVRTTRIYCRPICRPGRAPKPENCVPFPDAASARAAGYRACKQCRPDGMPATERAETVRYGVGPSPFGLAFVGLTDRGVCALFFRDDDEEGPGLERLRTLVRRAEIVMDRRAIEPVLRSLESFPEGEDEPALDLRGTPFQIRVWEALRAIPPGSTRTYGALARELGMPGAARAVGAACGANPVGAFVPCHRAIGADGSLHGYRWGLDRKRALLDRERAPLFA